MMKTVPESYLIQKLRKYFAVFSVPVDSGGGMHSSLIPPYNKDAERPEDVYSIDSSK